MIYPNVLQAPVMFWKHVNPLFKSRPDHHVDVPEDGGADVPQNELVENLPAVHQQLVLRVLVRVGIYPKSTSVKKMGFKAEGCLISPGNDIKRHFLVNVFDLHQSVLLCHFFQVVKHRVDPSLQQLQHPLDLS